MGPVTSAEAKVRAYLEDVRAGLSGLPAAKAAEIVEELRSHIRERAGGEGGTSDAAVSAALLGLGSASDLAAQYAGGSTAAAGPTSIPAGLLGLAASALACLLGAALAVAAVLRPFVPERAGLWRLGPDSYSIRLGLSGAAAPGSDVLGAWTTPVGLAAAALLLFTGARLGAWGLRRSGLPPARPLVLGELLAVLAIFAAEELHLVPLSKTPFLLLVAWGSLRLRRMSWRDLGLGRPDAWARPLLIGTIAGACLQTLELRVLVPVLERLTGRLPDVSDLQGIVGNPTMLLLALLLNWTLAAFGEEMVFRGYLMNRVAEVLGGRRAAWVTSLALASAAFGLAHIDQGLSGRIENGISGLALGALYLACGRNLWVPIVAHGVSNTIDLVLIYLGRYPGL